MRDRFPLGAPRRASLTVAWGSAQAVEAAAPLCHLPADRRFAPTDGPLRYALPVPSPRDRISRAHAGPLSVCRPEPIAGAFAGLVTGEAGSATLTPPTRRPSLAGHSSARIPVLGRCVRCQAPGLHSARLTPACASDPEELPIRLAHRVKELDELPHNLAKQPSIEKVKKWYAESFEVSLALFP